MEHTDRILRLTEVCERLGRSRPSLWRDVKAGRLPSPRKIGPRAIGWLESEITEYLRGLPRAAAAQLEAA